MSLADFLNLLFGLVMRQNHLSVSFAFTIFWTTVHQCSIVSHVFVSDSYKTHINFIHFN